MSERKREEKKKNRLGENNQVGGKFLCATCDCEIKRCTNNDRSGNRRADDVNASRAAHRLRRSKICCDLPRTLLIETQTTHATWIRDTQERKEKKIGRSHARTDVVIIAQKLS